MPSDRAAGGSVRMGKTRPSRPIKRIFELFEFKNPQFSGAKRIFRPAELLPLGSSPFSRLHAIWEPIMQTVPCRIVRIRDTMATEDQDTLEKG